MNNVDRKLLMWLADREHVNAKLLQQLILPKVEFSLSEDDMHQIYPVLLVALQHDTALSSALHILRTELTNYRAKDYQLSYLKAVLNMMDAQAIDEERRRAAHDFHATLFLQKKMTIERAYQILFYVKYTRPDEELPTFILHFLPALMVDCAKKYQLIEFSVLTEAFSIIKHQFPESFYQETRIFIEQQQSNKGYFGFTDPFLTNCRSEDEVLLTSVHMYLGWREYTTQEMRINM